MIVFNDSQSCNEHFKETKKYENILWGTSNYEIADEGYTYTDPLGVHVNFRMGNLKVSIYESGSQLNEAKEIAIQQYEKIKNLGKS